MGCRQWAQVDGDSSYTFGWVAKGTLLADGLCIGQEYARSVAPFKGNTTVYSTVEEPRFRGISISDGTVAVDFKLTMRWVDPDIKTLFDDEDRDAGYIVLSKTSLDKIWTPDLYILDRRSFKLQDEWASLKRSSVLTRHIPGISIGNYATIELQYEIKSTVYCRFYPATYPMDRQICNLTFGSGSFEAMFVLYDLGPISFTYNSSEFEIQIQLFDNMKGDGSNTIGMNIEIGRIISPFLLKYYVPCIGIVLLSALSFAIPVTAIPGRVSLLVTLFLTLTNVFIHQMVSHC